MITPNGYSNLPAAQPRPLKRCPTCSFPLTSSETTCMYCAQTNKGVTPDVQPKPLELPSPRPELEGGK